MEGALVHPAQGSGRRLHTNADKEWLGTRARVHLRAQYSALKELEVVPWLL